MSLSLKVSGIAAQNLGLNIGCGVWLWTDESPLGTVRNSELAPKWQLLPVLRPLGVFCIFVS